MPTPARTRAHTGTLSRHLTAALALGLLLSVAPVAAGTAVAADRGSRSDAGTLQDAGKPAADEPVAAERVARGRVRGEVRQQDSGASVVVTWFDDGYRYLGRTRVRGGAYSLSLAPGTYRLQFTDTRPTYDTRKAAPTDARVRVSAGSTVQRSVRLRRGASITGSVRAGGKPARKARLVAAAPDERTFEVVADKQGRFALGGLPSASYSLFTYDSLEKWTGTSSFFRKVKAGSTRNVAIRLNRKAGRLLVDLYDADRRTLPSTFVTAVNRYTGQFWVERATRGTVTFAGLSPGRYRLDVAGAGNFLAQRRLIGKKVRSARVTFADFVMTRRGASLTGRVVDATLPDTALEGALVVLTAADGGELGRARSNAAGAFRIAGPLDTSRGSSLVVRPDPANGSEFLGVEPHRKEFGACDLGGIALTQGRATATGDLALPRKADATSAPCQVTP